MNEQINPANIMQIGSGFMASKTLLTAIKFELFTALSKNALTGDEIKSRLKLHERGVYDFLDTLVSLNFLKRDGNGVNGKYSNSADTDLFLDKNKPSYIGGILEMFDDRLYKFWDDLGEGLQTGKPQTEVKTTGKPVFEELYSTPDKLKAFLNAMEGVQINNFVEFANKFDFSKYKTLCDMGGASALLTSQIVLNNEHMTCTVFDLPPVEPIANDKIHKMGLSNNVKFVAGDFFKDDFPKADIITMGNILHDWNLENKKILIKKAYEALPNNGAFVVIENIIDDERRENTFGLLISLTMLIEFGDAFDFTHADFDLWAKEAGFARTEKNAFDWTNKCSNCL